jgi:putative addiction module component (TIGR02574 family)
MDLSTVMTAVGSWPVDDRLRLMEEIWDQRADEGYEPVLSDELQANLDRRLAALDANPRNAMTWEGLAERRRRPG